MSMFERQTCAAEGCEETVGYFMESHCDFHRAIHSARELSPDRLADLRVALGDVRVLTDEQKSARRIKSYLNSVTYHVRELARAESRAREAGATDEQITAAHKIKENA